MRARQQVYGGRRISLLFFHPGRHYLSLSLALSPSLSPSSYLSPHYGLVASSDGEKNNNNNKRKRCTRSAAAIQHTSRRQSFTPIRIAVPAEETWCSLTDIFRRFHCVYVCARSRPTSRDNTDVTRHRG